MVAQTSETYVCKACKNGQREAGKQFESTCVTEGAAHDPWPCAHVPVEFSRSHREQLLCVGKRADQYGRKTSMRHIYNKNPKDLFEALCITKASATSACASIQPHNVISSYSHTHTQLMNLLDQEHAA